ncbi:hypothetical protein GGS20DRAFT_586237 [Poronia punctata]|nr:hypothetical protein GGS20DRAFT_586237 [Poronia punctata]
MSRAPRLLLPKTGESSNAPPPPPPDEPSRAKRDTVTLACQKCRARKVKCDGERPICAACRTRNLQCEYRDSPDATTRADLQRRFVELEKKYHELLELIEMLKNRPEAEAHVILLRLRRSTDIHSTLAFINQGDLLAHPRHIATPDPRNDALLSSHHPKIYPASSAKAGDTTELGVIRKSILEMNPDDYEFPLNQEIRNARRLDIAHPTCDERTLRIDARLWTRVTTNNSIVANLISLYLSWDHCTMRLFDEDYFLDQIATGQTEYCSPLLVNALLAAASLNYSAIDKEQSQAMGREFFGEASRLWATGEDEEAHILRIPGALLMSAWSSWNGKRDMARFYLSQAVKVAQALGLSNPLVWAPRGIGAAGRRHKKGIATVAWGLFNFHTINKFFGLIDVEAIDLPGFPFPYDAFGYDEDPNVWDPFPLVRPKQIQHLGLWFRVLSELLQIAHAFMAEQDPSNPHITYEKAKMMHEKMLAWGDRLPPELERGPESLPAVLDLHMFYHGIVAKAFRPFTGADFLYQEQASSVLEASLTQLRRILYVQRHRFDGPPFNATTIGSVHVLTFSLLEGLARSDEVDRETSFDMVLAAESMKKYGEAFPAIKKSLHRLLEGASRRHAELPHELKLILEELSARFFSSDLPNDDEGYFPIDLQVGMTDQHGRGIAELVNVTYRLKVGPGGEATRE